MLFFLGLMNFLAVKAQDVDEIINKHIAALGGKEKISNIKTIYIESTMEIMGNEAPTTTYIVNGKGYRSETNFNGQKIIQCFTDKGGWSINPGQTTAEPVSADQVKNAQGQLQVGGPLFDYAAKGNKVELQGKEDVNGASAYKIKVTSKDTMVTTFYIDVTSYYILKVVSKLLANGQETETIITFSDYRKTDFGNVMPFEQQVVLPQLTLNIINKKIEMNKEIDPKIFEMPK